MGHGRWQEIEAAGVALANAWRGMPPIFKTSASTATRSVRPHHEAGTLWMGDPENP
jgi:hypothetical protein